MKNTHKPYGIYEKYIKRLLDIICGLLAIIFFWWLYIVIAVLVRIKLGSPVLFAQDRPNKDERDKRSNRVLCGIGLYEL